MGPIIIGLDPGATSAFVAISLDFKLVKAKSKKNYPLNEIIKDVLEVGTPLIVGSDKKDIQGMVKEFSQKTGAKIHLTRYDTKKDEKKTLVKASGFVDMVNNIHESDAMAAAIYAYNDYKTLVDKTRRLLTQLEKEELFDKVVSKSILEDKSIKHALEEIEHRPQAKIAPNSKVSPIAKKISKEEEEIKLLRKSLAIRELELDDYQHEIEKLKSRRVDINSETKKIISFKENRALNLESENKRLKSELAKKDKIIARLNLFISSTRDMILLKNLDNLQNDEYSKKNSHLRFTLGDIIYVKDLSGASNTVISRLKEKCNVIIFDEGEPLKEFVCIKNSFKMQSTKYFSLIPKQDFEDSLRTIKIDKSFIKNILDDYKHERLKEIV